MLLGSALDLFLSSAVGANRNSQQRSFVYSLRLPEFSMLDRVTSSS